MKVQNLCDFVELALAIALMFSPHPQHCLLGWENTRPEMLPAAKSLDLNTEAGTRQDSVVTVMAYLYLLHCLSLSCLVYNFSFVLF